VKEIVLTDGSSVLVDDEDFDRFAHLKWYGGNRGYAVRWIPETKTYSFLHRELTDAPAGMVVDHIDRNPRNNTRQNLRIVTKSEDLKNRAPYAKGRSLKPLDTSQRRFFATPLLAKVIEEQGRRKTWMGAQIRVSNSQVSHVLAGRRTVAERDAETWSHILGVPFFALWKLADASDSLVPSDEQEAIPA
jgi:hypothetical protein